MSQKKVSNDLYFNWRVILLYKNKNYDSWEKKSNNFLITLNFIIISNHFQKKRYYIKQYIRKNGSKMLAIDIGNEVKSKETLLEEHTTQAGEAAHKEKQLFKNKTICEMLEKDLYPITSFKLLGIFISLAAFGVCITQYVLRFDNYNASDQFFVGYFYAGYYLVIPATVLMTCK